MKLFNGVFLRLLICVVVVLLLWAVGFYYAMMDEITDEVDDSLEDYSEMIIIRSLAGDSLPSADIGSNNQYFIKEISPAYAMSRPAISYKDSMIYVVSKKETEPARMLTTIFKDSIDRYYELEVSIPTIEKKDLRESIFHLIILLFLCLVLNFLLISTFVFKRTMKPFYQILEWVEKNRLGSGSNGPQVVTSTTEFSKLNEALVKYAHHSEDIFQQQKQFIGNASHEIQTPIAVCINRIEMMMEDENLSETQLEELLKTHKTLVYVSKLNKSLLLLTKIENNQFSEESEVDSNSNVIHLLEDYKEVYAYKEMEIVFQEKGIFKAKMNHTLGEILVANLIKNAFVHTAAGGKIWIICSEESIEFRNTAEGGALDGEHIFERFYQFKKKEESMGLGLAIAEAICKSFNLQIKYSYGDGMHSFRVSR